jgi:molybdopterin molybdotransferase
VAGEGRIGQAAESLSAGSAIKIVTGAPVPAGAEAIIRREDVREFPDHIVIPRGTTVMAGQDIRKQGQNIRAGQVVVEAGTVLTAALIGALASFGLWRPTVYKPVRLGIIVTGDELLSADASPQPWQLRDSNGPAMEAMFAGCPWLDWQQTWHVGDDLDETRNALADAIQECDAVLMTGGVSMGDRDYAQAAVEKVKAAEVFHGLPIRPGKPMLGAIGAEGQAILGLPGNPVSVLVTARRLGAIVLRRLAGFSAVDPPVPVVAVDQPDVSNPDLWLYRPVRLSGPGTAEILPTKGSGDLVSSARSDGFVEIPPATQGKAHRAYYRWAI